MNFTVSFLIEQNIFIEDAKDETEATQKAANNLLGILNRSEQSLINHSKITVEKKRVE